MENNKFNGFMAFLAVSITLLFLSLKVQLLVSFICALVCVMLIKACWFVYCLLWRFAERVDLSEIKKKNGKRFKG